MRTIGEKLFRTVLLGLVLANLGLAASLAVPAMAQEGDEGPWGWHCGTKGRYCGHVTSITACEDCEEVE